MDCRHLSHVLQSNLLRTLKVLVEVVGPIYFGLIGEGQILKMFPSEYPRQTRVNANLKQDTYHILIFACVVSYFWNSNGSHDVLVFLCCS